MDRFGDFQTCLEEGWAFMKTGEWCETEKADQLLFGMLYPCVMNYTFSCELFMKSIALHNSPDNHHPQGHGLVQLFGNLPAEAKKRIEIDAKSQGINDVQQFLKEHDLSFNDWRYAFEKESVTASVSKLSSFSKALYSYAESVAKGDFK